MSNANEQVAHLMKLLAILGAHNATKSTADICNHGSQSLQASPREEGVEEGRAKQVEKACVHETSHSKTARW